MCTQRAPYNHSQQLYANHGEIIKSYLERAVLPAIKLKQSTGGVPLLEELKFRWDNHVIMNKWYSKFFAYLNRYYVKHHSLPDLTQAGLTSFKTNIYDHVKVSIKDAIIELIDKERDGELIDDKDLIKSTVMLFETMGMGTLDSYNKDLVRIFDMFLLYKFMFYFILLYLNTIIPLSLLLFVKKRNHICLLQLDHIMLEKEKNG